MFYLLRYIYTNKIKIETQNTFLSIRFYLYFHGLLRSDSNKKNNFFNMKTLIQIEEKIEHN